MHRPHASPSSKAPSAGASQPSGARSLQKVWRAGRTDRPHATRSSFSPHRLGNRDRTTTPSRVSPEIVLGDPSGSPPTPRSNGHASREEGNAFDGAQGQGQPSCPTWLRGAGACGVRRAPTPHRGVPLPPIRAHVVPPLTPQYARARCVARCGTHAAVCVRSATARWLCLRQAAGKPSAARSRSRSRGRGCKPGAGTRRQPSLRRPPSSPLPPSPYCAAPPSLRATGGPHATSRSRPR